MRFNSIEDIKDYIRFLRDDCGKASRWNNDLIWFSDINYTTTTEYLGELMLFLKKLKDDDDMTGYKNDISKLINMLNDCLQ